MDQIVTSLMDKIKRKMEQENLFDSTIKQIVTKAISHLYPYILGVVCILCLMIVMQGVLSYQLIKLAGATSKIAIR